METKLTEQGLDVSDQYHRTRSDQQALIDQTAESVLTDQAVGELAELVSVGYGEKPKRPYERRIPREEKKAIIARGINEPRALFAVDKPDNCFATNVSRVPPKEDFYDVALHGAETSVEFFGTTIDAYTLAQIIRQRGDYQKGVPIRLLSCNTGNVSNTGNCVAQLLANELGVTVIAPTDILYVSHDGTYKVGRDGNGRFKEFYSRGRNYD